MITIKSFTKLKTVNFTKREVSLIFTFLSNNVQLLLK